MQHTMNTWSHLEKGIIVPQIDFWKNQLFFLFQRF